MGAFTVKLSVSQSPLDEIIDKLVKKKKLVLFVRNAVAHYAGTPKGRALYEALVGEEYPGSKPPKQKRGAAVKEPSGKPSGKSSGARGDDTLSAIFKNRSDQK